MDLYLHFDRIMAKKSVAIYRDAMPIELKAFHICVGSGQSVAHLSLPIFKQLAGKSLRARMITHAGSDKDILTSLQRYGLKRQNVSSVVGGNFTLKDYAEWLDERDQLELPQYRGRTF